MSNDVEVEIFGQTFRVAAGATSPEYVQHLAAYVDERMRSIAQNTKTASFNRMAVLTALNIADDLLKLQDSAETLEQKTARLLSLLESHPPDA